MGTFTEHDQIEIAELAISKEAKKELEEIQKDPDAKISATTIIKKDKKLSIKSEFVLAFTDNLCTLASLNITQNELKIITYILKAMEYGNLVSISQASIARELNLAKSNVSYNFKKLKAKGILIDKDGNIYMNSNLFSKGLAHAMSKENRENLKNARGSSLFDENQTEHKLQNAG